MRRKDFNMEGQGHVFNAWDKLNDEQKRSLYDQTEQFDVTQVNELFDTLVTHGDQKAAQETGASTFEPVEARQVVSKIDMDEETRTRLYNMGRRPYQPCW